MKTKYLFLLFSLLSLQCFAAPCNDQIIFQEDHHYVTVFRFKNILSLSTLGCVSREKNGSSAYYQVYDENGWFLGSAEYTNSNSNAYAANMKLIDLDGNLAGTINGEFWTAQPAKFTIKSNTFNGYAYLSSNKQEFTIVDQGKKELVKLYRYIIENEPDYWEIHVLKPNTVPDFILKIFAAFACDTHGQFIQDN